MIAGAFPIQLLAQSRLHETMGIGCRDAGCCSLAREKVQVTWEAVFDTVVSKTGQRMGW